MVSLISDNTDKNSSISNTVEHLKVKSRLVVVDRLEQQVVSGHGLYVQYN